MWRIGRTNRECVEMRTVVWTPRSGRTLSVRRASMAVRSEFWGQATNARWMLNNHSSPKVPLARALTRQCWDARPRGGRFLVAGRTKTLAVQSDRRVPPGAVNPFSQRAHSTVALAESSMDTAAKSPGGNSQLSLECLAIQTPYSESQGCPRVKPKIDRRKPQAPPRQSRLFQPEAQGLELKGAQ